MNRLKIRKLGVFSVAKIYSVMALVMGLIIGIPYGLFTIAIALFFGAAAGSQDGNMGLIVGGGGVVMGLLIMIGIPIVYSIIGFIAGVICALVYNIFAGIVGGIEIEVYNVR